MAFPTPSSSPDRGHTTPPSSSGSPGPAGAPPVKRRGSTPWPLYLVVDLALVLVFAALGRSSHHEDLAGVLATAWPFLVGTLVGWLICRGDRRPAAPAPTGLCIWLSTEITGMVLRALTGQGTALPFVLVSLVVLGALLIGYRLALLGVRRIRSR